MFLRRAGHSPLTDGKLVMYGTRLVSWSPEPLRVRITIDRGKTQVRIKMCLPTTQGQVCTVQLPEANINVDINTTQSLIYAPYDLIRLTFRL